jgi:hypothetical protein
VTTRLVNARFVDGSSGFNKATKFSFSSVILIGRATLRISSRLRVTEGAIAQWTWNAHFVMCITSD